ncbi:MAG TPA: hypothetical protein VMV38_01335 [Candidatus Paceibacterota bacterium]|nr:hypothetical protein [Candidatus Paceibacterota bacterium]
MKNKFIIGGIIVLVVLLLSWNRLFPTSLPILVTNPNDLPGIQTGTAPWSPEITNLEARLKDIGLPALHAEGSALHIHQHLDMVINGYANPVPADIGINQQADFISPIHTHDGSGVIHVESPTVQDFTLGQFFDIWGVRFTKDALGGYTTNATSTLGVYVNGSRVSGDPRTIVLAEHQEIMIVYGTEKEMPQTIISSYSFPVGE